MLGALVAFSILRDEGIRPTLLFSWVRDRHVFLGTFHGEGDKNIASYLNKRFDK